MHKAVYIARTHTQLFDSFAHCIFQVSASDGIFEFITNEEFGGLVQNVHDRYVCQSSRSFLFTISFCEYFVSCCLHPSGGNPMQCCDDAVEEAYARWMDAEDRTDDITMICAKLQPN